MPPETALFAKGFLMGFFVTIPVGPVGVLCIGRLLAHGRLSGFVSGLGGSTADAIFAALAAFSLTFMSGWLVANQAGIRLVASFFLLYIGLRTFFSRPVPPAPARHLIGYLGDYLSVLALAISNPMIILTLAAGFAALGVVVPQGDLGGLAVLVGGVFTGSALWWVLLSLARGLVRMRLEERGLRWINRVSGVLIAGFGVLLLLSFGVWRD